MMSLKIEPKGKEFVVLLNDVVISLTKTKARAEKIIDVIEDELGDREAFGYDEGYSNGQEECLERE
jgi:hypothetical protein